MTKPITLSLEQGEVIDLMESLVDTGSLPELRRKLGAVIEEHMEVDPEFNKMVASRMAARKGY